MSLLKSNFIGKGKQTAPIQAPAFEMNLNQNISGHITQELLAPGVNPEDSKRKKIAMAGAAIAGGGIVFGFFSELGKITAKAAIGAAAGAANSVKEYLQKIQSESTEKKEETPAGK